MMLTQQAIIDLARRYVAENDIGDFPLQGDLFCFVERSTGEQKATGKSRDEWQFGGYGLCINYAFDPESKPDGKWLLFNFYSLQTFPPTRQNLKLQPPHIVRGVFSNPARTKEIRIIRISDAMSQQDSPHAMNHAKSSSRKKRSQSLPDNILPFPGNKQ
jgi:hypothetical protein